MDGDAQRRFCGSCSKHVHDLSAMTEERAQEILEIPNVCVRFQTDASGRILHAPRPARAARVLAVGAALLGASPALAAPAVPPAPQPDQASSQSWREWLVEQVQSRLLGEEVVISERPVAMGEVAPERPVEMGKVATPPTPPPTMGAVAPPEPPPPPQPPITTRMGRFPQPHTIPLPAPAPPPAPLPLPEPGQTVIPEVQEALDKQGR
jgi:hypothetical protein